MLRFQVRLRCHQEAFVWIRRISHQHLRREAQMYRLQSRCEYQGWTRYPYLSPWSSLHVCCRSRPSTRRALRSCRYWALRKDADYKQARSNSRCVQLACSSQDYNEPRSVPQNYRRRCWVFPDSLRDSQRHVLPTQSLHWPLLWEDPWIQPSQPRLRIERQRCTRWKVPRQPLQKRHRIGHHQDLRSLEEYQRQCHRDKGVEDQSQEGCRRRPHWCQSRHSH